MTAVSWGAAAPGGASAPLTAEGGGAQRMGIVALFFALRVPLLFLRQPFFDELFTRWIAAKPFTGILHALRSDSGPPLYYFLVHALGDPPVLLVRVASLLFATIALLALLRAGQVAPALLLAVFPPAVLFAVDARNYALCAMFVTFGVLAVDRQRPYRAAIAFVLAAYSHYYGALFFPLLILCKERVRPFLVLLLFAPGVWLAWSQPRAAISWMSRFRYPEALFARPPIAVLIAVALLLIAAAWPLNRFTLMTLIPTALAIPIYVPLRFESVIASPLALWLGASARRIVLIALVAALAAVSVFGIVDHAARPIDDYRDAAMRIRNAREPVVATGYLYLETVSMRPAIAFPPEQGQHPGWRATATSGRGLPAGAFLWIGERGAPELSILRRSRIVEPLYVNSRAMIARVR